MMVERVKSIQYFTGDRSGTGVEDRVSEWVVGLPTADDLIPLSQSLIPPELASAFRISPEPSRSMFDVNYASQNTMSYLFAGDKGGGCNQALPSSNKFKLFHDETSGTTTTEIIDGAIMDIDDTDLNITRDGSDSRNIRKVEDSDSLINNNDNNNRNENGGDDGSAARTTLKRTRLVWTPQLHKRFVDVVAHLGIKNAVPKTIMQMMNVEGLTRENVASHLQKYRLYVKRMQGLSTEGPSSSDQLFASTPLPHSLQESGSGDGNDTSNGHGYMGMPFPLPYTPPPPPTAHMVPIPMIRMPGHTPGGGYYDSNHYQYGMMQQQMDWPNQFVSVIPNHYYHVAPKDK